MAYLLRGVLEHGPDEPHSVQLVDLDERLLVLRAATQRQADVDQELWVGRGHQFDEGGEAVLVLDRGHVRVRLGAFCWL